MNEDILKGNWHQVKGRMKAAWGKLTNDDLDAIEGDWEAAVGRLQERYGWEKEKAERELRKMQVN